MARDFEAELAAARSRVERIKKAQAAAERKAWQSVGKAAIEVFGDRLLGLTNAQLKAFFSGLEQPKETAADAPLERQVQASYPYGSTEDDTL